MKKKPNYQIPSSRDLTGMTVSGQVTPEGFCTTGATPSTTRCAHGESPFNTACANGAVPGEPNPCNPSGGMPTYGRCTTGANVGHGCVTGSFAVD